MDAAARINVSAVIDGAPVGAFQVRILCLCLLVSMLDGFDTQSIAFVAPSISEAWHLLPSGFGMIFSATLVGSALGSATLGRLADRYGRRRPLALSVVAFGLMTLACARADGFKSLLIFRLLAGIGLGGAIPNFLALASEYAPHRARSRIVVATLWGFPFGAVLGGLVSTQLIARFGWPSVFYVGGILPLVLAPLLWLLPESIRFLTLRPEARASVASVLQRIDVSRDFSATAEYYLPEPPIPARPIRAVFEGRLAAGTVLLGTAMFTSLLLAYLLVNWIPLLFRQIGMPLADAVLGTVILNLCGIVGSYMFSQWMDRSRGALRVLMTGYGLAALAVASIGLFGMSRGLIMTSTGLTGFFLIGTQMSLTAYIADYYPTAVRATGLGLTQAIGRCGSLLGPLIGGWLLSIGVLPRQLFELGAVPALLVVGTLLTLRSRAPRAHAEPPHRG